jgi:hypothetical protein
LALEATSVHSSLSQELRQILESAGQQRLSIGALVDGIGDRGFGLILLLLSLPSALPVPAPGYSTPFGVLLALLGVQILAGRPRPWLPAWARRVSIPERLAAGMLSGGAAFFARVEHLIRPRWSGFTGKGGHFLAGLIIVAMGVLMAIPIPGTNTAPAAVVFLVGVALSEEDGLFLGLASVLGVLAALFYGLILTVVFYFGAAGVGEALDLLRG